MTIHTRITATADVDLSEIMRAERIASVNYDRLLDRFTVTLLDYSCGGGASVGEALAQAKRRAA